MARIVTCPKCGFRFDVGYGRAFACADCPDATLGDCKFIKCPKCEHEFPKVNQQNFSKDL